MYHTVFLVESAYRNRWDVIHSSDNGRFLLPWEPGPNITRHELRSSVFRYVPSRVAFFFFTSRSTRSVLILSTTYFYCPKYGGKYWFKGPIRTIDVKDDKNPGNNDKRELTALTCHYICYPWSLSTCT